MKKNKVKSVLILSLAFLLAGCGTNNTTLVSSSNQDSSETTTSSTAEETSSETTSSGDTSSEGTSSGQSSNDGSSSDSQQTVLTAPVLTITSYSVSWSAVTGADTYDLYLNGTKTSSTRFTKYDFDTEVSTEQSLEVVAKDSTGVAADSVKSNTIKYTAPASLDKPVLAIDGKKVTWSAITNAEAYMVFVNDAFTEQITDTSYTVTATEPGVYTVYVVAVLGAKKSANSDTVSVLNSSGMTLSTAESWTRAELLDTSGEWLRKGTFNETTTEGCDMKSGCKMYIYHSINASMRYLKVALRTFVRDGEIDPQFVVRVNGTVVRAKDSSEDYVTLHSDTPIFFSYDLGDYIGQNVIIEFDELAASHNCITQCGMFDNETSTVHLSDTDAFSYADVKDTAVCTTREFNFASETDLGGWVLGTKTANGSGTKWIDWDDGAILMDGSDGGQGGYLPNCWMYNMFEIGESDKLFKIRMRGVNDADTDFRLHLFVEDDTMTSGYYETTLSDAYGGTDNVNEAGYHDITGGDNFFTYVFDISSYVGKKVLFSLEQDDDGDGAAEKLAITWIKIVATNDDTGGTLSATTKSSWTGAEVLASDEFIRSSGVVTRTEGCDVKYGEELIVKKFYDANSRYLNLSIRNYTETFTQLSKLQVKVDGYTLKAVNSDYDTIDIPETDDTYIYTFDLSAYKDIANVIEIMNAATADGHHMCFTNIEFSNEDKHTSADNLVAHTYDFDRAAMYSKWTITGANEGIGEGVDLKGSGNMTFSDEVDASHAIMNVKARSFSGQDSTHPSFTLKINDTEITSIGSTSTTNKLPLFTDDSAIFSFDLTSYVGQTVSMTITSTSGGSHMVVQEIHLNSTDSHTYPVTTTDVEFDRAGMKADWTITGNNDGVGEGIDLMGSGTMTHEMTMPELTYLNVRVRWFSDQDSGNTSSFTVSVGGTLLTAKDCTSTTSVLVNDSTIFTFDVSAYKAQTETIIIASNGGSNHMVVQQLLFSDTDAHTNTAA